VRFTSPLAASCLLLALASAEARADEPRLPISVSARPLAIGRFILLLGAEPGLTVGGGTSLPQVVLPLRFGITDDLEAFAGPVAQGVDPIFHEPALGVVYRVIRGPVEVGARVAGDLSLFGQVKSATLQLGIPLRIHAGSLLAIDLGAHALLGLLPQNAFGLLVPVGASLNLTDQVFIAAASGLKIADLGAAGTFSIPLAGQVGYTIPWGDHPFIDVAARAGWDDVRGAAGAFTIGVSGKLYLLF